MLNNIDDRSSIDLAEIQIDDVAEDILQIIRTNQAFFASKVFGAQGFGSPEEYDKLVLEDDNGSRTFEYFNKGISYMMSTNKKDRPIFQVFTHFMLLQHKGNV